MLRFHLWWFRPIEDGELAVCLSGHGCWLGSGILHGGC